MDNLFSHPVPIIFAICQGVQQLSNGGLNFMGVFDRATVHTQPDGSLPDAIGVEVAVIWTGGQGQFEEVLRVFNPDGQMVAEKRSRFTLNSTSHRHGNIGTMPIPARPGVYSLVVARGDEELLRQDFTVVVGPPR